MINGVGATEWTAWSVPAPRHSAVLHPHFLRLKLNHYSPPQPGRQVCLHIQALTTKNKEKLFSYVNTIGCR